MKKGLLLISIIMFAQTVLAQKPNYKFKSINQSDGLINSTVQTIFEDSFGFIWLGTHQGVQRYDGKSYKNFQHNSNDTSGLSMNYINDFCEDTDRNIWITTAGGLNKYDRKTDNVKRYQWQVKLSNKNNEPNLLSIIRDESDEDILWLTMAEIGLVRLNIRNDSAEVYSLKQKGDKSYTWILPYPGNSNKLLLGGTKLFAFDKSSGQFDEILSLAQNSKIPNNIINHAAIDPTDNDIIWLATGDYWGRGSLGGLIRFNLKTASMKLFSPETRENDMPDRHLLHLCFSDNDDLWVGTRNSGALLYDREKDRFYSFEKNVFDEASLITDGSVRSIVIDRSGTVWFGTWGDGISLLSPAAQKFSRYKYLPSVKNGLQDNYINTFAEDKDGNIWIGTKAGGLSKFDPRQKSFENYFPEFTSAGTNPAEINSLFYDSRGNLWIGTYADALYRFNPSSGETVHYREGSAKNEVTQKRISAITEIRPGEILISTYGGGLNIFDYSTGSIRHYMHNPNDPTSIPDNQIWTPFSGNDGNYYFSGNSKAGLIRFNPETETFSEVLSSGNIETFMMPCKTSDGRVFINDGSEGLRELHLNDEITVNTVYDINENSISNIESILVDADNKLWMGTGNGLVEYDPATKISKRYDPSDGLQGYEFNRMAALKSSAGEMYFGGKNGFNVFHPNTIERSDYEPPVVFTRLQLFREDVTIGEGSPLKQNILLLDKIELDHDQNDFSVSFAALDFSNPQKIIYKYFLENHDEDWILAGHNNFASYTNMDPGKYTLKVRATNGDGIWNDKEKSIRVIIHPPWWLTNWAYGFYILLFAASLFGVDRLMRNRLIRRERERSRAVELDQAKKIEKAYIELKSTQSQLIQSEKMASLGELTAGIAHEIQNPLNFVNNFAEVSMELIDEMKHESAVGGQRSAVGGQQSANEIIDDIRQNLDKILQHGKRADTIVKGMLQHSRTSTGQKEPTDINALCDEYLRLAYHGLRAKDKTFNADFKTDLDPNLPKIEVIPQDMGRVILNLITNAFYAVDEKKKQLASDLSALSNLTSLNNYEPTVSVSTKKTGSNVLISVKDNGNGIPDQIKDKIFQPFFTTKPSGQGTGLGLSMSYDIITKGHGGDLKVESKAGEGAEFNILIPIN